MRETLAMPTLVRQKQNTIKNKVRGVKSLGARAGAIQADAEARLTAKEKIGLTAGKLAVSAFSDILGIKAEEFARIEFQPPDPDSKKNLETNLDFHSILERLAKEHISNGSASPAREQ